MSEVNELVAKVNFKFRGCGDFKRNVWASINVLVTQTIFRISGGLASRSRATQMRCSRQVKTLFQGLDSTGDGSINLEEFSKLVKSDKLACLDMISETEVGALATAQDSEEWSNNEINHVLNCKSTFNDMRSFTVDSVSLTSSCANLKFTSVFQLAQVLDESAGVSPTFKFGNLFLDETLGRDMGCSRLPMSY